MDTKKTLIISIVAGFLVIVLFMVIYSEPEPEAQSFDEVFLNQLDDVEEINILSGSGAEGSQEVQVEESEVISQILDDFSDIEIRRTESRVDASNYIISFDNYIIEMSEDAVMFFTEDGVAAYEIVSDSNHLETIENDLEWEEVDLEDIEDGMEEDIEEEEE
ncbi:hypothetical protein [Alkalibacillus haloalkaliphilus]|uniref:hypothetical protein n=1 Tax=Alkalibacillus haloalkaliphilus TaxID=94136 RepID=UPI00293591B1|nr:hypothetical protein [Alkalibacillus haloalkaliphilus]MDV2582331.1 hypothetical protein [Alkalibacillus haloalkaliphilus]